MAPDSNPLWLSRECTHQGCHWQIGCDKRTVRLHIHHQHGPGKVLPCNIVMGTHGNDIRTHEETCSVCREEKGLPPVTNAAPFSPDGRVSATPLASIESDEAAGADGSNGEAREAILCVEVEINMGNKTTGIEFQATCRIAGLD